MFRLLGFLSAMAVAMSVVLARADDAALDPGHFNPDWSVVFPAGKARELPAYGLADKIEDTWTPTPEDIAILEPALVARFGRTPNAHDERGVSIPHRPEIYYRQYGGVVAGGRRVIVVNGFHKGFVAERIKRGAVPDFWKNQGVLVFDGGCGFFHADFDVATGEIQHLLCQGEG